MVEDIKYVFNVDKDDFVRAGETSSKIKKILRQLGIDSAITRKISIAAYEAEMNIVIHSIGGCIELKITPDFIRITANDKGPGIDNVELAMKEGYSTATDKVREMGFGAGMGLPNMKKCSDRFSVTSSAGSGTVINIEVDLKAGD
ncbi:MAG TPA: ATP-binding protein [Bacillota bacterium]|nr:ATP-binding protein [Bacillota bacterium]HOR85698.1 ATP-binding protein [Bacillota bacterium]HPL54320.1 ATP-binding protein [Bacillota bacterium]